MTNSNASKEKRVSLRDRFDGWMTQHPITSAVIVGVATAAALVGTLAFVVFSDFGGTADFIYNQF